VREATEVALEPVILEERVEDTGQHDALSGEALEEHGEGAFAKLRLGPVEQREDVRRGELALGPVDHEAEAQRPRELVEDARQRVGCEGGDAAAVPDPEVVGRPLRLAEVGLERRVVRSRVERREVPADAGGAHRSTCPRMKRRMRAMHRSAASPSAIGAVTLSVEALTRQWPRSATCHFLRAISFVDT